MSIYINQIRQLISLQKVDDEIHTVKTQLEQAPQDLSHLQERFAAVTAERTHQQDKMHHLHEQEKRLGLEIEDESIRLKKSKSKLMQVENSREYNAVVREMDSMERMNRDREEEKNTLLEELALQKDRQQELEERYSAAEQELKTCEAGIQERMDALQKELDTLLQRRGETAKDVPGPVFSRYEFIRERLEHPVIVPVTDGICSGCHIAIPPQNFIELQKGTQILSCPNCQRLMFWVDHFLE